MALSTRLFVGNLPNNLDEIALRDVFSTYGNITNFDLKSKPGIENEKKLFAFVTISGSNFNIESCMKHFANETFQGNRLHVTRARESFLERLQREREQSQKNDTKQAEYTQENNISESFSMNNRKNNKRKFTDADELDDTTFVKKNKVKTPAINNNLSTQYNFGDDNKNESSNFDYGNNKKIDNSLKNDDKKQNSDKKRLESMLKKRQEFNEKKNIIKFGLTAIDKKPNKKVVFSDNEEDHVQNNFLQNGDNNVLPNNKKSSLFEDEASDDEINFGIKKQFEGKKGQKVLDLQSRYKSDKRFVLDERFVEEDSASEKEDNGNSQIIDKEQENNDQDIIEVSQADEKSKQLGILQDVLGITIKPKQIDTNKTRTKLGMLRFDPTQPEHAKYFAPVETKPEPAKKSKKKKGKNNEQPEELPQLETITEKVEVSKEQFYKVSDTLKEAISQPNSFSLRSLFANNENVEKETVEEDINYVPIKSKKETKVKNPFEPGEKNPFVYDSSESENEEDTTDNSKQVIEEKIETKIVWREKLFFTPSDNRLKDGLLFFSKGNDNSGPKERRELKSLMKKRIYNKERKNTMFQKKIGGRKKTMKKKFKKG